jgi:hypothetical protein
MAQIIIVDNNIAVQKKKPMKYFIEIHEQDSSILLIFYAAI